MPQPLTALLPSLSELISVNDVHNILDFIISQPIGNIVCFVANQPHPINVDVIYGCSPSPRVSPRLPYAFRDPSLPTLTRSFHARHRVQPAKADIAAAEFTYSFISANNLDIKAGFGGPSARLCTGYVY